MNTESRQPGVVTDRRRWSAAARQVPQLLRSGLIGFGLVLGGCQSRTAATTSPTPPPTAAVAMAVDATTQSIPAGATPVQIALASTDLALGPERFAFAILTPGGNLIQYAAAKVTFLELDGDRAIPITTTVATYFPARLDSAGLYVARHSFTKAGPWGAQIEAALVDGREILPQRVRFTVQEAPKAVGIGASPPKTANRTVADEPNLARLSSDPMPDPDFYQLTVEDAAASGKPTVIVFATPGHCSSRICGPVLDEVKVIKAAVGGAVNFIHIDVYREFSPLVLDEAMDIWGLKTEPWVYLVGADGLVAERLEGSVTAAELGPLVNKLLKAPAP